MKISLQKALEKKPDATALIQMVYSFLRDFPQTIKNEEFRKNLEDKLKEALSTAEISDAQELQLHFFHGRPERRKNLCPSKRAYYLDLRLPRTLSKILRSSPLRNAPLWKSENYAKTGLRILFKSSVDGRAKPFKGLHPD